MEAYLQLLLSCNVVFGGRGGEWHEFQCRDGYCLSTHSPYQLLSILLADSSIPRWGIRLCSFKFSLNKLNSTSLVKMMVQWTLLFFKNWCSMIWIIITVTSLTLTICVKRFLIISLVEPHAWLWCGTFRKRSVFSSYGNQEL